VEALKMARDRDLKSLLETCAKRDDEKTIFERMSGTSEEDFRA
jgi:hypothetical protein